MPEIKLSALALGFGAFMALLGAFGVFRPATFARAARGFPRHTPVGYALMLLATAWFIYNLSHESISDFASFKPLLYTLFMAVGIGTCLFVRDFLPVRGLAVLLLLMAKLMVDTARWVDTEWRLVITTWAYVWVLAGMWFTVSPWRLRDLLNWCTINDQRTRIFSGVRLALGVLVLILGFTAYPAAERQRPLYEELDRHMDTQVVSPRN